MDHRRLRSFALFCCSGGLALLVDLFVLWCLIDAMGPYAARAVSFWCAASFTWVFNRSITFKGGAGTHLWHEYATYLLSMMAGGALNYGVYAASITWWPFIKDHPYLAVGMGSLAGLVFNYAAASRIMNRPVDQDA